MTTVWEPAERVRVETAVIDPDPFVSGIAHFTPPSRLVLARTIVWPGDGTVYETIAGEGKLSGEYLCAFFVDEDAWRENSQWVARCERLGARVPEIAA